MRKTIVILSTITATALSGCVSLNQLPIDANSASEIKGKTTTYTTRKKPDFTSLTAGKAAFGLIGALVAISEGNKIISDNNIADPADDIALGLAEELKNSYGVILVAQPIKVDSDDAAHIASSVKDVAQYVIDAQTINWSIGYFPTDWTHYRTMYMAKVRIINVQTKNVVAEGFCSHVPSSNVNAPTYDELMGNQAAGLKSDLKNIVQECINTLKTQILNRG